MTKKEAELQALFLFTAGIKPEHKGWVSMMDRIHELKQKIEEEKNNAKK